MSAIWLLLNIAHSTSPSPGTAIFADLPGATVSPPAKPAAPERSATAVVFVTVHLPSGIAWSAATLLNAPSPVIVTSLAPASGAFQFTVLPFRSTVYSPSDAGDAPNWMFM